MNGKAKAAVAARKLLPNEPRIPDFARQDELTARLLAPRAGELFAFFEAVRRSVDPACAAAVPTKHGKPYPYGQCLEISLAVADAIRGFDAAGASPEVREGQAAFQAFLAAGGGFRRVWGDLRGEFFQNAFLLGTLYVDVSNDTVQTEKAKVEILPFAESRLIPVADYRHFVTLATRYWRGRFLPNHALPEIAPFCPLIHVTPGGFHVVRETTHYIMALVLAGRFDPSETMLRDPAMPQDDFAVVAAALRGTRHAVASDPEEGRRRAIRACETARAKRWYVGEVQMNRVLAEVRDVNRRLAAHRRAKPAPVAEDA